MPGDQEARERFGKLVEQARLRRQWTVADACRESGVKSATTWANVEKGVKGKARTIDLVRLALGLPYGIDDAPEPGALSITELSDEDLVAELSRRLAERRALSGDIEVYADFSDSSAMRVKVVETETEPGDTEKRPGGERRRR